MSGFPVTLVLRHPDGREEVRKNHLTEGIPTTGEQLTVNGEPWVIYEIRIDTETEPQSWTIVVERE